MRGRGNLQEDIIPLDSYLSAEEIDAFLPAAIAASQVGGRLVQVPRMVDARLLFYRADLLDQAGMTVPESWEDLREEAGALAMQWRGTGRPERGNGKTELETGGSELETGWPELETGGSELYGYVFPGRFSGLFGTFYELVAMAGGHLFDGEGRPVFDRDAVEWALGFLHGLYSEGIVPPQLIEWHYDEVSACFREGHAAFVADWPAFFALYNDPKTSQVSRVYGVARYPVGPAGKRAVYAGMHSFAIPATTRDMDASLALLRFLLDEESQWLEAEHGAFPTRSATLERLQRSLPAGSLEANRLSLLTATMEEDLLMFPPLVRYPIVEDELWPVVQAAVTGHLSVGEAATRLRSMAEEIVR